MRSTWNVLLRVLKKKDVDVSMPAVGKKLGIGMLLR